MGFPHTSTPDQEEGRTSFGRLKGLGKARSANAATLVLTAQNALAASPAESATAVSHPGPSIISANVEMTGSLSSPNELHIYGAVDGNVRAADLTIFAGGSVKGDVIADNVLVHGSVDGRIHAKKVQLSAGAVVRGDIVHASLGVDTGSTFEGVSRRSENPAAEIKPAGKRNGSASAAPASSVTDTVRHSSPSQ